MHATARIPIQVVPSEKKFFAQKAKRMGMSLSEFARRAMNVYKLKTTRAIDLDAMLKEVHAGTVRAQGAMDDALTFCRASNKRIAKIEATRKLYQKETI